MSATAGNTRLLQEAPERCSKHHRVLQQAQHCCKRRQQLQETPGSHSSSPTAAGAPQLVVFLCEAGGTSLKLRAAINNHTAYRQPQELPGSCRKRQAATMTPTRSCGRTTDCAGHEADSSSLQLHNRQPQDISGSLRRCLTGAWNARHLQGLQGHDGERRSASSSKVDFPLVGYCKGRSCCLPAGGSEAICRQELPRRCSSSAVCSPSVDRGAALS